MSSLTFQTLDAFTASVIEYPCGKSMMYQVPFLSAEQAEFLLRKTDDDFNATLRKYLETCTAGLEIGDFPNHGIRVTGLDDPSQGKFTSLTYSLLGICLLDDRLVSSKINKHLWESQLDNPIADPVLVANAFWSERLWDGDKSNEWVDHFRASRVFQALEARGLPASASLYQLDRYGQPKFSLLRTPRSAGLQFDIEASKYRESISSPGKGYMESEIAERYPLALGGLSRWYTTNVDGIEQMLQDFQSQQFGEIPSQCEDVGLTVCISYHWYTGNAAAARFSNKTLEQLSLFILTMNRLFRRIRFWCDYIGRCRGLVEDPWEDIGLVPYAIWPTLYVSSQVGSPEDDSFKRIWISIEQFCCTYGRGAFVFSFDLSFFNKVNPWTRRREHSSMLDSTSSMIRGRYGGVDETLYALARVLRYGLFDECLFGTWESYVDIQLMQWANSTEKRVRQDGTTPVGPFIFADEYVKGKPPSTTLITGVVLPRGEIQGFEGTKSLLPPSHGDFDDSWQSLHDASFEYATVYPFDEDESGVFRNIDMMMNNAPRIQTAYTVITRPESGYGNCWMCEVVFGSEYHPDGHCNKLVHYISSNGRYFPKVGLWSGKEESRMRRGAKFDQWFLEAADVIDKMAGKSIPRSGFGTIMLTTTTGLPKWDGYGLS